MYRNHKEVGLMETITLTAPDISCEHCQRAIEGELGSLAGVKSCAVDIGSKQVMVTFDPSSLTRDRIVATLAEEGYPVAG
jgi:copper chaperone